MEASETPTPPEDIAPEEEAETDPFADVEADPLVGEEEQPLPPGVEEGTLGGVNPTEEAEAAAAAAEAEVEAPVEEEGEPLPPAEVVPSDDEPVEQPEEPEEPAAEVEPSPDPEDEEQPEVPEPEPEPEPTKETPDDPETGVEGSGAKEEKPKRSRRRRANATLAKGDREYVILIQGNPGEWVEAFPRDAKKGEGLRQVKGEPTTIVARNGEVALRRAYRLMTGEGDPENHVLVATPKPYFKPKAVNGRVMKQTAISIA